MSQFDSLTPEAREWLANAIAGMVLADGSVDASEIVELRKNVSFLDSIAAERLIAQVKRRELAELEDIRLEKQAAFTILKELTKLAVVDKEFSDTEEEFLRNATQKLGFPTEVAERMVAAAHKVVAELLQARLTFRKHRIPAICMDVTRTGCTVSSKANLPEELQVMLEVGHLEEEEEDCSSYFSPLPAKVRVVKPSEQSPGSYLAQVDFGVRINLNHGILHRLYPGNYQKGTAKPIKTVHDKMTGVYGVCRTCGNEEVELWSPAEGQELTYNIFGLPSLARESDPVAGFNYLNYQPAVCPQCLFASPDHRLFYIHGQPVLPLQDDTPDFQHKWITSVKTRRQLQDGNVSNWADIHERQLDDGLNAWKLAVETHTTLSELGKSANGRQLQLAAFSLIQEAELQLLRGFPSMAQGLMQRAIRNLVEVEERLTQGARTHALALLVMLSVYDEDQNRLKDTLTRMREHRKAMTDETETALVNDYFKFFEGLIKDPSVYGKSLRKNFDPTDEAPGISAFGKQMNFPESI